MVLNIFISTCNIERFSVYSLIGEYINLGVFYTIKIHEEKNRYRIVSPYTSNSDWSRVPQTRWLDGDLKKYLSQPAVGMHHFSTYRFGIVTTLSDRYRANTKGVRPKGDISSLSTKFD